MRKKKGQAMVEAAIVIPIFLLFFCGIIDFGRILHAGASLNMVAQESVRLAGLGKSDTEVKTFAYNNTDLNDKKTMQITLTPSDLVRKSGDYVTIDISYEVKYITPFMNLILTSPFKVHSKSTIRVE